MTFRPLFCTAAFVVCLTLGGISSAFADEAATTRTFQQILASKTLRVGVSIFTPWTLKDKDGKLVGFEIDVANKLARDMGVTVKLIPYIWEELIPALKKGEIDIIAGGMAITPKRALKVNFSRPYATSGINLATNTKATRHIKSLKELNQKQIKIAVVAATVSANLARRIFAKAAIEEFKKSREAEQALLSGSVHAYMASKPQPRFLALQHADKIDVPLSKALLVYQAGFAIPQGDVDFLSFLNAWIVTREADNWLKSTHAYWFESLKWQQDHLQ